MPKKRNRAPEHVPAGRLWIAGRERPSGATGSALREAPVELRVLLDDVPSGRQEHLIPAFQQVDDSGPEKLLGSHAKALRLLGEVFRLRIAETRRETGHDRIMATGRCHALPWPQRRAKRRPLQPGVGRP